MPELNESNLESGPYTSVKTDGVTNIESTESDMW